MDNGSLTSLTIERLPEGGYVVSSSPWGDSVRVLHYACTHMQEALQFVDAKVRPIGAAGMDQRLAAMNSEQ